MIGMPQDTFKQYPASQMRQTSASGYRAWTLQIRS
jgi:hypothetical protein